MVYELSPGEAKIEKFVKNKVKYISIIRESREVSLNIPKLDGGKSYVIVPSTKTPGLEGKFYLSLYFDCKLRHVNINCLNDNNAKCILN